MGSVQFKIKDLKKFYNGTKVLDISDLAINKGEIYGVMGPNGSGKTTLLSILALLVKPTSGMIFFDGLEMNSRENNGFTLRREMTMVFQNPFLFKTTVEKNVAYGLRIRCLSKKEQRKRVSECLDLVGLTGFQKRKANELSSGEIQRVAIARAIAVNPKVLFLDEPTANIDKMNIDLLEKIVKQLNCIYKATIIFATHDFNQACRLADKVIILSEGKIREILDP
ncbi:MAG: ABC transporter ATP-binding protein [Thermodesulfobacteriota bacterium]|nr:ABC transporter ATP-binding protein [Thermodesulfobacteriota bacterium]